MTRKLKTSVKLRCFLFEMHEGNLEHIQGHVMHGRDMHSLSQHLYIYDDKHKY